MAYFEPYIDAEGIHIPTYADRMEKLIEEYRKIFGADAYLGVETPDYQLLSVFARCLDDEDALAVDLYNARNPNYAPGNALDLQLPLVGMTRRSATQSSVTLTISGLAESTVPAGAQAVDTEGNLWTLQSTITFADDGEGYGTTTVEALCETYGAVPAKIGSINSVYTPVPGWNTVYNNVEAILGNEVETDAHVRYRMSVAHSREMNGTAEAIIKYILEIDEVKSAVIYENTYNYFMEYINGEFVQSATQSGDISNLFPGHSICCVVDGGDDNTIAKTIYQNKSPGCGTWGTTTQKVADGFGSLVPISFSRPIKQNITVTVSIRDFDGYGADKLRPQIANALMADVNSLGVGKGWTVTTGYKDIYDMVQETGMPIAVLGITATSIHGATTVSVQCDYNEVLVLDDSDITVTIVT